MRQDGTPSLSLRRDRGRSIDAPQVEIHGAGWTEGRSMPPSKKNSLSMKGGDTVSG